jgi:hypothetical protein
LSSFYFVKIQKLMLIFKDVYRHEIAMAKTRRRRIFHEVRVMPTAEACLLGGIKKIFRN